ncbi:hypothetical protein E2320_002858 [Naja naja]|nr:hypothetical protein E2320_002858 [Naja naja]
MPDPLMKSSLTRIPVVNMVAFKVVSLLLISLGFVLMEENGTRENLRNSTFLQRRYSEGTLASDYSRTLDNMLKKNFVEWLLNHRENKNDKLMSKQLETFKSNLEEFASKHKQEIRKNPEFRVQFQNMCATIGVDPLASGKGFWSEMLGVGDFYYELGVQIIEVCLALKHRNGGLIILDELHQQVLKGRGKFAQDVSQDDLIRAIKKLKVLGNGFGILPVGGTYLIQSVPAELNMDHTVVIQLAEKKGYVTISEIKSSLKWEMERAKQVLDHLLKEGMAWLDTQAPGEPQYWLPALFTELYSQEITPEEAKEALP